MSSTNDGKKGGILSGKKHSECDDTGCGIAAVVTDTNQPVELETEEVILTASSMTDPKDYTMKGTKKEIASAINSEDGKGVSFEKGAEIINKNGKTRKMAKGGNLPSPTKLYHVDAYSGKQKFERLTSTPVPKAVAYYLKKEAIKSGSYNGLTFKLPESKKTGGQINDIASHISDLTAVLEFMNNKEQKETKLYIEELQLLSSMEIAPAALKDMRITMLEGVHITATEKRRIKELLEIGETVGHTAKKEYEITERKGDRIRVEIKTKEKRDSGEPFISTSKYLLQIKGDAPIELPQKVTVSLPHKETNDKKPQIIILESDVRPELLHSKDDYSKYPESDRAGLRLLDDLQNQKIDLTKLSETDLEELESGVEGIQDELNHAAPDSFSLWFEIIDDERDDKIIEFKNEYGYAEARPRSKNKKGKYQLYYRNGIHGSNFIRIYEGMNFKSLYDATDALNAWVGLTMAGDLDLDDGYSTINIHALELIPETNLFNIKTNFFDQGDPYAGIQELYKSGIYKEYQMEGFMDYFIEELPVIMEKYPSTYTTQDPDQIRMFKKQGGDLNSMTYRIKTLGSNDAYRYFEDIETAKTEVRQDLAQGKMSVMQKFDGNFWSKSHYEFGGDVLPELSQETPIITMAEGGELSDEEKAVKLEARKAINNLKELRSKQPEGDFRTTLQKAIDEAEKSYITKYPEIEQSEPAVELDIDLASLPRDKYNYMYDRLQKIAPNLMSLLETAPYPSDVYGKSQYTPKEDAYMALSIEGLEKDSKGRFIVALAHYYVQQGDMMCDPCMTVRIDPTMKTVEALSFKQDGILNSRIIEVYGLTESGKEGVNIREKKAQNSFLNKWTNNLVKQGHVVKFRPIDTEEVTDPVVEEEIEIDESYNLEKGQQYARLFDERAQDIEYYLQNLNSALVIARIDLKLVLADSINNSQADIDLTRDLNIENYNPPMYQFAQKAVNFIRDLSGEKVTQTPELIDLEQLTDKNPLSTQLTKHTGDSYSTVSFVNESGEGLTAEGIIVHIKTGQKFRIPEKIEVPKIFQGIDHNYKNQFVLNKAIEEFLTSNGDDYIYSNEEKAFLLKYEGYGGLEKEGATGSVLLWEYYTPEILIKKMWGLANKYGHRGGKVLEPSVGVGRFLAYASPQDSVTAYEISAYSAKICKIIYPDVNLHESSFSQYFYNNNVYNPKHKKDFDLVIGNPPYGEFVDKRSASEAKRMKAAAMRFEHYFILRGLDTLKSGGLLVYVSTANLFTKGYDKVKERIAEKADLVDAYLLPQSTFKRTSINTSIIVLRRK